MDFIINIKRKKEKVSGIYIIKNNINDMVYIGRSVDVYKRAKRHKQNFYRLKVNKKLKDFIKSNNSVVFTVDLIKESKNIVLLEEEFIKKYDSVENGFNIIENDKQFYEMFSGWKFFNNIDLSIYLLNELGIESLKRGYIRKKDGSFTYNPSRAKKIYKDAILLKENEETKTKKVKCNSVDFIAIDFSFLTK